VSRGEKEDVAKGLLVAYAHNPTLEYRLVEHHNGEQVGDILDSLQPKKRTAKPKAASKPAKPRSWATYFRKYPTIQAWLDAHPGQLCGRVVNPPSAVRYFSYQSGRDVCFNYSMRLDGKWNTPLRDDYVYYASWSEWRAATGDTHKQKVAERQGESA
jgi:hypothetical protein